MEWFDNDLGLINSFIKNDIKIDFINDTVCLSTDVWQTDFLFNTYDLIKMIIDDYSGHIKDEKSVFNKLLDILREEASGTYNLWAENLIAIFLADTLEAGSGEIYCRQCGKKYSAPQLNIEGWISGGGGRVFLCPKRHVILKAMDFIT